jgi:competence protein ComEA
MDMNFEELRLRLREKIEDLGFDLKSYQPFVLLGLVILLLLGVLVFYWWNRPVQVIELKEERSVKKVGDKNVKKKQFFLVHVAGAVKRPGVYQLSPGKRVIDAITVAGGGTEDAYLDALNLAAKLSDEMKIYVPSREEVVESQNKPKQNDLEFIEQGKSSALVNINRASLSELEQLPGIGPVLARRIIEYRKNEGLFTTIEDLKKIEGIGPKKFQQLKGKITVD